MASFSATEDVQKVLVAIQLVSEAEIQQVQQLAARYSHVLSRDLVFRILLTYLPIDASLSHLIPLLESLRNDHFGSEIFEQPFNQSAESHVRECNPSETRAQLSRLRLQRVPKVCENQLTNFLLARAHQIEAANGDLPFALRLVEPFIDHDDYLRLWVTSKLLPLLRLQYEYYPDGRKESPSLRDLELLEGRAGVDVLLQNTMLANHLALAGRDLRGIVAPWVYGGTNYAKRRKIGPEANTRDTDSTSWADVNEWILETSVNNFPLAAIAIKEWAGPGDIDLGGYEDREGQDAVLEEDKRRYAQAALAAIYSSSDSSTDAIARSGAILERASSLLGLREVDRFKVMPPIEHLDFNNLSRANLLHNALLLPDNKLTRPSNNSISFLGAILASLNILKGFKIDMNTRAATELCLFGSEEQQKRELSRLLQQIPRVTNNETDWEAIRAKLLYLQRWTPATGNTSSAHGLFWKVPDQFVGEEILKAILVSSNYRPAIEMYLDDEQSHLIHSDVEACVLAAIYNAYDNASNGNRTRGGMKRAFELLKAFQPHFSQSTSFTNIDHLIAATHSLSFYHLTLQHGVPFQPVSIRVHKDPLSLVDKVLEQNARAYTKVDDLQEIGRNIVLAGLPATQSTVTDAQHRITYAAIISALAQHDFETAYSYVTTRLSSSTVDDDMSWRAAYAAGRYQSPNTPQSLTARISSISRRMDLLSSALRLSPAPEHLSEILDVWRSCEEDMDSLKAQDANENRVFEERGSTALPGGFGLETRDEDIANTKRELDRRSTAQRSSKYEDEAPMGLFDVARGAAAAIQKTAFPLRAATQREASSASSGHKADLDARPGSALSGEDQRVRKRDMVSNAVTGGMLKGMSWVLGAEPVSRGKDDED